MLGGLDGGKYSREETIQGQKLFAENTVDMKEKRHSPEFDPRIWKPNNGSAADYAHHTVLRNLFIPWTVSTRISGLAYCVNIPKGDGLPKDFYQV